MRRDHPRLVDNKRLEQLVDAVLDDRATCNEMRELGLLLQASNDNVRYFRAWLRLHVDLCQLHRPRSDDSRDPARPGPASTDDAESGD